VARHRHGPFMPSARNNRNRYGQDDDTGHNLHGAKFCDFMTCPNFVDCLELFISDPDTDAVIMIGEIGGTPEVDAAEFLTREKQRKLAVGFIAGLSAPPGRRMGHAGAIVMQGGETAAVKIEAPQSAGVLVAPSPGELGATMLRALKA
jgi:succinyl-CoA synthetase alpha subunit